MPHGDGEIAHEGATVVVEDGTGDVLPADRVGSIENDHVEPVLGRLFEDEAERGDVGVEASAGVLDVEDERVDALQLFGGRSLALAVQAVDRRARGAISAILDLLVPVAGEAVLGAEDRYQRDVRSVVEHVGGATAVARAAGVVGHEPHVATRKRSELVGDQAIDPQLDHALAGGASSRPEGEASEILPQLGDVTLLVGVKAAGEQDEGGAGLGVDPEVRPGKAGVADAVREERVAETVARVGRVHGGREGTYRRRGEDAGPIGDALAGEHDREPRHVVGRADHAEDRLRHRCRAGRHRGQCGWILRRSFG